MNVILAIKCYSGEKFLIENNLGRISIRVESYTVEVEYLIGDCNPV